MCLKKAGSKVDVSQGSCASQVGRVSEGRDPVLHQVCGRREEVWPAADSTSCGGWVLFLFFDAGSVLYRGVLNSWAQAISLPQPPRRVSGKLRFVQSYLAGAFCVSSISGLYVQPLATV